MATVLEDSGCLGSRRAFGRREGAERRGSSFGWHWDAVRGEKENYETLAAAVRSEGERKATETERRKQG